MWGQVHASLNGASVGSITCLAVSFTEHVFGLDSFDVTTVAYTNQTQILTYLECASEVQLISRRSDRRLSWRVCDQCSPEWTFRNLERTFLKL